MSELPVISVGTAKASKLTGIPPRTLQDMAKRGEIPAARRIGKRRFVFVLAGLNEMIQNAPRN